MKILIAGDSWGVGEWLDPSKVLHGGLAQYFKESQHDVVNVSHGGISNLDIATRIGLYLERNRETLFDKVFVFQTEYHRDLKHWYCHDDRDWQDVEHCWIERFYQRLSEISVKHSVPIYLIGGASDTMWFDDMNNDYPGCHVACQSMTNLLCYQHDRSINPVYSWYSNNATDFLKELKARCPDHLEKIMAGIDLGYQREALVRENPRFFYPDGVHPNRHGHRVLFDFLLQKNLVDA